MYLQGATGGTYGIGGGCGYGEHIGYGSDGGFGAGANGSSSGIGMGAGGSYLGGSIGSTSFNSSCPPGASAPPFGGGFPSYGGGAIGGNGPPGAHAFSSGGELPGGMSSMGNMSHLGPGPLGNPFTPGPFGSSGPFGRGHFGAGGACPGSGRPKAGVGGGRYEAPEAGGCCGQDPCGAICSLGSSLPEHDSMLGGRPHLVDRGQGSRSPQGEKGPGSGYGHPNFGGKGQQPFGGCSPAVSRGSGKGQKQTPHSNLFVGNLPQDATERMLREAFAPCGNVVTCRVFTRNGRTCALVKMGGVQEAEQACKSVSRTSGGDPKTRWLVKFADADVGGSGSFNDGLKGACQQGACWSGGKGCGSNSNWNSNKGGGCAPMAGTQALGNWSTGKGGGERRRDQVQESSVPSDNLYVKGLLPRITEAQLYRTFSKVGKVVEMKILRYGDSLECAALVRMADIEAAKAAIESLNGTAPEGAAPPLTIRYHGKDPSQPSDNLYVKGLPPNFTQDNLHCLFGQCGTVRRSRVLMPPARRAAQDSAALVQMSSAEEATRVIQMLNGRLPEGVGPRMAVRYAEPKGAVGSMQPAPSDNLYVKGLPLGTPDFLLRAVFAQFGTVVRLKVLEPRAGEAMDCAALVQMSSVEASQAAVQALHGRVLAAPLPPMRVRFAGKDQQPGSNLYVAGLPLNVHEQQLRTTFARCGTVSRLKLLVQPGRLETHALVQMASADEAKAAIAALHNTPPESSGPTLVVRYATNRGKESDDESRRPSDTPPVDPDTVLETSLAPPSLTPETQTATAPAHVDD